MASNFLQSVILLKAHCIEQAAARAKGCDLEAEADLDRIADAIDGLEFEILTHQPQSLDEAIAIAELVTENLVCGPRSDGLDVAAMSRVLACARAVVAGQTRMQSAA